jgi:hypothetical protein
MFSPEFMKFLINYQKDEFMPEPSRKVIYLRKPGRGKKVFAEVYVPVRGK